MAQTPRNRYVREQFDGLQLKHSFAVVKWNDCKQWKLIKGDWRIFILLEAVDLGKVNGWTPGELQGTFKGMFTF